MNLGIKLLVAEDDPNGGSMLLRYGNISGGDVKRMIQRKIFPGYVLIDMIVNNYSWYVVRNTQGVTGFVGSEKTPIPLSPEEAERILNAPEELRETLSNKLKVNDQVRIIAGWFVDYEATVKEIDEERQRLKVLVENTPVDLEFRQVEKI